jgi:hypothetical protein
MKVAILAILLLGTHPASSPNSAPAEIQHFGRSLSGEWSIEFKVNPSDALPKGGNGRGHEVWKSGPGGMSFIEEYQSTGDEGDITGRATFWWDEHLHRIQVLWCANYLPEGCEMMSDGASWDGNRLILVNRWDSGGRTHVVREIFSDILPTSFTQTIYQGESLEKLSVTHIFRATRNCCSPLSTQ